MINAVIVSVDTGSLLPEWYCDLYRLGPKSQEIISDALLFSFTYLLLFFLLVTIHQRLPKYRKPLSIDAETPRPLFLRSFYVDKPYENIDYTNAEEFIAPVLSLLGPPIAIDDPRREKRFGVPIQRIHAQDNNWHVLVERLAARAPLVLLQIGITEGLAWELERLRSLCAPKKVLLVVAGLGQSESGAKVYRVFREHIVTRLGIQLPLDAEQGGLHCIR